MIARSHTYCLIAVAIVVACLAAGACKKSAEWPITPTTITVRFDAGERATSQSANGFLVSVRTVYTVATSPAGPAAQAVAASMCDGASIRYFDAQGREQPAYNPNTTVRATAKGTCVNSGASILLDLVLDDMQASSPAYLVNGTAQSTYEGYSVNATLTNVRVPKQGCAFPTSGDMSIRLDQTTIVLHFDGSTTVTGTYSVAGRDVTFSVSLAACQP